MPAAESELLDWNKNYSLMLMEHNRNSFFLAIRGTAIERQRKSEIHLERIPGSNCGCRPSSTFYTYICLPGLQNSFRLHVADSKDRGPSAGK